MSQTTTVVCELVVAATLCLVGCCKSKAEGSLVDPGKTGAVPSGAVPSSTSPALGRTSTDDGLVSIVPPSSPGWVCVTDHSTRGARTSLVKCRREQAGEFFFMMAKDYSVPRDQIRSAKHLSTVVYRKHYEDMFTSLKVVRSEATMHGSTSAYEQELEATHQSKGRIRKIERVMVASDHVLVLSAEGRTAEFTRYRAETDRWFNRAKFASLKR